MYNKNEKKQHITVIDNERTIGGRRVREFYDPREGCIVTEFLDPPPPKEVYLAQKRKRAKRMAALQKAWEREEKLERFLRFWKRK